MNPKRVFRAGFLVVAIGLVYTLSPLTVWFAIGIVPVVLLGTRGLDSDERRWVTSILVFAIAALFEIAGCFAFWPASPRRRSPWLCSGDTL